MATLPSVLGPVIRSLEEAKLPVQQDRLRTIIQFAHGLYGTEKHWTGMTRLEHALAVLQLLLPFHPDADTVTACILQHALDAKAISTTELQEQFGPRVRALISGVHLLSRLNIKRRGTSIEDLRLMLISIADDISILLITLSKHVLALERANAMPVADRKRSARDALNLSAPIAARLGIHTLKQRLENLAFPIMYPSDAERISEQLGHIHERYGSFLDSAARAMQKFLREQGAAATVQGREKQPYSIFSKMRSKSLSSIESLPDLFALRVIVDTEADCYQVLGALHRVGRPVPNRFKDYIAFPKPNGYQSLHTTVAKIAGVPDGLLVEVQVRTRTMHREAEYGIAAHWSYKEGGTTEKTMQRVQLLQALTSQQTLEGGTGTHSRLADHIFVLTPKGELVELPEGATPLDFAFQIHTDLGLSFRAARVNGSIVSLDYELENGDVVEIVTQRTPRPSPEWLHLLKMASSRSRLKRYLNMQHREEDVARGRELVNSELRRRGFSGLDTSLSLLRKYDRKSLTMTEREDLLMKIGQGTDKIGSLLQHLDLLRPPRAVVPAPAITKKIRFQRKDALIDIEGGVPMPLKFAKCCKPQEGERSKIVGVISRAGDVMIHSAKCKNAMRGNPERKIGVRWRKD